MAGEVEDDVVWIGDEPASRPAPRPFPRKALLIGAAAVALLAAVVTWFILSARPDVPEDAIVGYDRPPTVLRAEPFPTDGSVTPWLLGGDAILRVPADEEAPIVLTDMATGEDRWSRTGLRPRGALVSVYEVGDDKVAIEGSAPADAAITRIVDLEDGSPVADLAFGLDQTIAFTDTGRPVVVQLAPDGAVTLLDNFVDADVWETRLPPGLDFAQIENIEERDGYLHFRGLKWGGLASYPLALSVSDGSPAPWMPEPEGSFQPLGDDYLVSLTRNGEGPHELRSSSGEVLWQSRTPGVVRVLSERLFHQADDKVQRLHPRTGEEMWNEPAEVPEGSTLLIVDGSLLAVSVYPKITIYQIDMATGAIREDRDLGPGSNEATFHAGEDKLFLILNQPEKTRLMTFTTEGKEMWSRDYTGISSIWPMGNRFLGLAGTGWVLLGESE